MHFYTNSYSLQLARAFDGRLSRLDRLPLMAPFEVLFIYLPIVFHAALGIWISVQGRANLLAYSTEESDGNHARKGVQAQRWNAPCARAAIQVPHVFASTGDL